jgi:hypothetical protein
MLLPTSWALRPRRLPLVERIERLIHSNEVAAASYLVDQTPPTFRADKAVPLLERAPRELNGLVKAKARWQSQPQILVTIANIRL